MDARGRRMIRIGVLMAMLLAAAPAGADEASTRMADLEQEIEALAQRIQEDRSALDAAETALEETERRISALASERDVLAREISDVRTRIDELDRLNDEAATRLPALREQLGEAMRVRHHLSRQSRAGIFFNQDDPATIQRMLTYFDYLLGAQTERIDALRADIADILGARRALDAEHARLEAARSDYQAKVADLEQARAQRTARIAELGARIEDSAGQLAARRREQERLARLLEGIDELRREHTAAPVQEAPPASIVLDGLEHRRGTMKLPAAGRVATGFGVPDPMSGIPSSGIVIETGQYADVRSISDGQVVYSDWFRGFGLLLILDHGEGFMSLYGYNSELLYPVGASVAADTPVARAGDTSGRERIGVYFEIRRAGRPLDPLQWCESRSGQTYSRP